MSRKQLVSSLIPAVLTASLFTACLSPAQAQNAVDEWDSIQPPPAPKLQTVTVDPHTTALLVMDFNTGNCVPGKRERCVAAVPKVKALIDKARAHGVLVIHTGYPNMKPFVKDIAPQPGQKMIVAHADKFMETDLDKILKDHGITTVIATGTAPNGAVLFTSFAAANRGYKVIVPVDTMPGESAYSEQNAIWNVEHDPSLGHMSTLTSSDRIDFR